MLSITKKKKVKTNTEMTGMMEFTERDFRRALVNMLSDLKKNLNIMRRKVEDVYKNQIEI